MAKEKEIDLNSSDDSELALTEEPKNTIKGVLDENDSILPLKEVGEESLELSQKDNSLTTKAQSEEEIKMSLVESDDQMENSPAEPETEIILADNEEQGKQDSASEVRTNDLSDENDDSEEDDPDTTRRDDDEHALAAEDHSNSDEPDYDVDVDEENQETKTLPGGNYSEIKKRPKEKLPTEPSKASNAIESICLDDDDEIVEKSRENNQSQETTNKYKVEGKSEKATAENYITSATPQDKSPQKEITKRTTKDSETPKSANRSSSLNKIFCLALIMLIAAGFVLYYNPSLIGLIKVEQPATPPPGALIEPVTPIAQAFTTPLLPSKRDQCATLLEEAVRLRNVLLEKKNEISDLDLNYRNGIAELEEEIYQQIKKEGISSYEKVMKNKRLELSMRTIQRRQSYIKELTKPVYWLNNGSEELLYLVRKARLDLQVSEVAGGVDLNKHKRHISAAIQKYRPSPNKLAVNPLQSKVQPLEKIWQQVSNGKDKKEQISLNLKDQIIINQICAGNFERIAELTSITHGAARCLSQMKGLDLFLNNLTTISPDAAKQLFKWQGNWICLNGVKQLSPAVAQYLFKWQGNWISLNSLIEFPPELAMFLLKWEGLQLELMGLKYIKNEATQKTLKYLALWETTGGKLFVSDKIRQEMLNLIKLAATEPVKLPINEVGTN